MIRAEVQALIPSIIPQAKSLAWRHFQRAPHALDREELESIAFEGLMQAANAWESYCERHGYSPEAVHYFGAYANRRMTGAILDFLRASDWVTRSTRQRVKRLQEAGADSGSTREELAERTGLSEAQIVVTQAAVARKPVSLDDGERDVTEVQDVEQQAAVSEILAAVAGSRWDLTAEAQVVLALHYYSSRDFKEIAGMLGMADEAVARLHDEAVAVVHRAMARAVA